VKLVFRPVGRGNWRTLVVQIIEGSELLFPALRDGPAEVGQVWTIQGRDWRLVEIRA
jgi:hypothetical protein